MTNTQFQEFMAELAAIRAELRALVSADVFPAVIDAGTETAPGGLEGSACQGTTDVTAAVGPAPRKPRRGRK